PASAPANSTISASAGVTSSTSPARPHADRGQAVGSRRGFLIEVLWKWNLSPPYELTKRNVALLLPVPPPPSPAFPPSGPGPPHRPPSPPLRRAFLLFITVISCRVFGDLIVKRYYRR